MKQKTESGNNPRHTETPREVEPRKEKEPEPRKGTGNENRGQLDQLINRVRKGFHHDGPGGGYEGF